MRTVSYSKSIPVWKNYDVIVCGSGPAGSCAAVAAARQGAKVALVERYGILGGNLTVGHIGPILGMVSKGTIRDELVTKLGVPYNDMIGETGKAHDMQKAKTIMMEFVNHENIDVYLQTMVADAYMESNDIRGVIISTKEGLKVMTAAVVVDATGDGDVATFAGCDIEKGRDDGLMQPVTLEFTLDNVAEDAIYCIGDVDDVQFKGQRFLDWCKEQGEAGLLPKNIVSVRLHPTNNKNERQVNATQFNGLDSTKVETMFQADLELRRQIDLLVEFFRKYLPGYENCKYIASGTTTGIRETRRVIGEYYIPAEEMAVGKRFEDVVVHKAEFVVDIHNPIGPGQAEAKLQYCDPYDLPYGCFVPKKVDGLFIAGRCISGTHRAHASYRVMSICMAMGEAVGIAAAMCAASDVKPRDLDVKILQKKLTDLGIDLFSE